MSAARRKGTAWESAIVAYLRGQGWPAVERRALGGSLDRGDIAGIPQWVIEAKATKEITLGAWMKELTVETANAQALYGALWIKRRGFASPENAYVVISVRTFVQLLDDAGY